MRLVLAMTALAVFAAPALAGPKVEFKTSLGDFTLELDPEKAPKTVANFLEYVKAGHYDGTLFHRVIDNFMIQGGGFLPGMKEREGKRPPVENEATNGLKNLRGTVAMARTSDPHSATAQFFVSVKDNDFLDHRDKSTQGYGYCVFGKVVAGMETVDKIKGVATGFVGPFGDVPKEDVVIQSARLLEAAAAPAAPAVTPAAPGTAEVEAGTTPVKVE